MGNSTKIRRQAKQLKGRKVCITLHDGRSYVGWISGLEQEALLLSRPHASSKRKRGRTSPSRSKKVETSAFLPMLAPLFGGGAGAGAGLGGLMGGGLGGMLGGGLRFFGMIQKAMPVMKMGYGMIKTIKPFMNGLKGLMGGGAEV